MGPQIKYTYIALFFSLFAVFSACSHKTLSVFFDGVPNPEDSLHSASDDNVNQTDSARINEIIALKTGPKMNYHMPYYDKECTACHDMKSIGKFVETQPQLCYQCHIDFSSIYTYLHAPVEMGECTSCHNPHMSLEKRLLQRSGQQICLSCHDQADIMQQENHDGIEDTDCTECHNPHGGSESNLLK